MTQDTQPKKEQATQVKFDEVPVYKKISRSGNARYISVTRVIPIDWKLIELIPSRVSPDIIMFRIRRVA